MSGWSCRPCARGEHDKCWKETNGVFCMCQHEATSYVRQEANRCEFCDYVLSELKGHQWCINHNCPEFEAYLSGAKT